MSYKRQDSTLIKLQDITLKRLKKQKNASALKLKRLWNTYRALLRAAILAHYSPSTPAFNRTKYAMQAQIRGLMQQFHGQSVPLVKKAVHALHDQSVLLHAWMLDQVTPANTKIALPVTKSMREADIISNPEAFENRWAAWLDSYHASLVQNIMMNAINENPISEAVDEVDQTKANTPAYTLIDAMNRIYEYEAQSAINQGAADIGALNMGAIDEEVWRTRGDLRVCDECDSNEGENIEDVGFPPAHPNCHCFTELVPASFAALLRSGDKEDRALADRMEADGIVPNALVIRDEDGEIAGKTIVDFASWEKGQNFAVSGQ